MNTPAPPTPIQKTVVLVGAGNAHLVFVRRWRMRSLPGVSVVLVNEAPAVPYSAMVPAHVSGDYRRDEITIDLVRLCRSAGVRLINESVAGIDPAARRVLFAGRPPLAYDALSLGLGSVPTDLTRSVDPDFALTLRPLAELVRRLERIDVELTANPRPFHLAVVGGGASGCELSLAIRNRLGRHPGLRITVFQSRERLLPHFPPRTARAFEEEFRARGIVWRVNSRVASGEPGELALADGGKVPCDAVLWATPGSPPRLIRESGLATDARGFLRVLKTLQSEADPSVFGTGDCVSFTAYPDLARSGVHAVRQGGVLYDNVTALLRDRPPRPFRPRRRCLYLLNTGDGAAVLNYGPLAWKARWVRGLKDRIDRRWVASFLPPETKSGAAEREDENPRMRCGGCGSKVSGDVLSAVLKRLEPAEDGRVLIGPRHREDAAVFRGPTDGSVEVQTVDYFRAFTDDPYLFGRVAALHAVSDLYAMNARPFAALAIATLPHARGPVQEAQLFELLSGAQQSFRELGVTLAGGHTTEGSELAAGFAVTGHADERRMFLKSTLKPGDRLILTKPLGTGALLAAWMRAECRAEWYTGAVAAMLQPNLAAAEVFARIGVAACTDVTGFGLAGHLLEMLDASGVGGVLYADRIPLLAGFREVVADGIVSTLHRGNAKAACRFSGPESPPAWLFDPQTAGGLLAAVPADRADAVLRELFAAGYTQAVAIGAVVVTEGRGPSVTIRAADLDSKRDGCSSPSV
ncbi:selenophosphate synthase : Selenide,water dikinase, putative OS=marine gamma proteobacterium HTCC2143 GN=GP2143_07969 PE=4 SV=1: Pyr_redox_2: Pyr_redox: AIRS: AIRS_C [Gemmataceae bacterium]|nr:selenophosphate synthase : Selenide,water dikinase, putative OS=marine gamma proteobacterium HTCC2143 GN=GP2143_07969 PE=4 SV=1: Pyr_redox_2: Pyr_redox: AIRS: AIRS_C [Gemmataceae bacterium]VTT99535.1 selenophosphate synthase : Selenide,water dikinase, putative OS=marine gamma proteobacterium HTCC2143 GN=GP2143_07969 PE=4 SV=1: Pyr_redox_2: Pyr_redox: AIRS: AIRS_C [Gemmataceae bacterium]